MAKHRARVAAAHAGQLPPNKPGKCGGCSAPKVHHWLGMDWYGVPAPVRWWKLMRGQKFDTRGCACICVLKDFWERLNKPRPVKV